MVGKDLGDLCGRKVPPTSSAIRYSEYGPLRVIRAYDQPDQRCTGTICHMASGQDDRGAHMWIGCPSCGWTQRQRLPEPVTASLFEEV